MLNDLKDYNLNTNDRLKILNYYEILLECRDQELINNNISTCLILLDLKLDPDIAIISLINGVKNELVNDEFIKLKNLAENARKLKLVNMQSDTNRGGNTYDDYRNLLTIMCGDYRVILVVIADRLTKMRALKKVDFEGKKEYAHVTLELYAKLAHRLGLSKIKTELEELSLYYLDLDSFKKIANALEMKKDSRDSVINQTCEELKTIIDLEDSQFRVYGRSKSIYSIYTKTILKNREIDSIYDLFGIRILCDTIEQCMQIQSYITSEYKFITNRYKNYISNPKANGYQSLHIAVEDRENHIFEIQVRTHQMHHEAETGFANHWSYKENSTKTINVVEEKLHLFRDIIKQNTEEELDSVNNNIFESSIYTYTPDYKIVILPRDSTVIDFAYKIHSKLGENMVGATRNSLIISFHEHLNNGDVIEIKRKANFSAPKVEWLDLVASNHARKKIKSYLEKEKDSLILEYSKKGEVLLESYIDSIDYSGDFQSLTIKLMRHFSQQRSARFYMKIATNEITESDILDYFKPKDTHDIKIKETSQVINEDVIMIRGAEGIKKDISLCCMPVPNDVIVGVTETGKSIKIHRNECRNIVHINPDKIYFAKWNYDLTTSHKYDSEIEVICDSRFDTNSGIMNIFIKNGVDIRRLITKNKDDVIILKITIAVRDLSNLRDLTHTLMNVQGILDVNRIQK